jgi:hypothetical protein
MQNTKQKPSRFRRDILPVSFIMQELAKLGTVASKSRRKVIATLSFPVRVIEREGQRETEPIYGNTHDVIAGIVGCRRPALLVCAGFSVLTRKNLNPVIQATKRAGTVVVIETFDPPASFLISNGVGTRMGIQYFSQGGTATRGNLAQLEAHIDSRSFTFLGRKSLLLICGEISVVCSSRTTGRVSFRQNVSDNLKRRILGGSVIINPTHTLMRRYEIREWRNYLSRDGRVFVSASNWESSKNRSTWRTLHSLWHDGNPQDYCRPAVENEWLCYREWPLP